MSAPRHIGVARDAHRPARGASWSQRVGARVPLWRHLTLRTRLTLAFSGLLFAGGSALVVAMTGHVYGDIYGPLPHGSAPSALDPDHDRFIGMTDELRDTAASHLLHDAVMMLLIVVVVSGVLGWLIAGRMLRRLTTITDAARRAGDATLHERLNLPGPADELKELADTFDAMLERLDASFAARKRFVANASHELRTPLTLTRTAVEVTLAKQAVTEEQWRAMAEDVARSTERTQRLLDGLLTLARSEETPTHAEDDDLADLAAEVLDQSAAAIRTRSIRTTTDLEPAPVNGNLALFGRAVANLVENAVEYNLDGGHLCVRTRTVGRWAELTVVNDGPGVDPDTVPLLFEPFHRGVHTRGGSARPDGSPAPAGAGLGLSIVRAVVQAHHGGITARATANGGLSITLRLPAIADRARPAAGQPRGAAESAPRSGALLAKAGDDR